MRTTASGQSVSLLFDVIALLKGENIDYAVIGAIAASVHGVVRATMDADIVLSITLKNLRALEEKFKDLGLTTDLREGDFNDPIPAMLQVTDSYENRVDLLAGLRGLDKEAFSRAIAVPLGEEVLKIMGREDFIASKVFAGGPQDLQDAHFAIDVAAKSLDVDLLRRITRQYGRDATTSLERLLESAKPG